MSDNRTIMSGKNFFTRDETIILSLTRTLSGSVVENIFEGLNEHQSNVLIYKLVDTRDCINELRENYLHQDINVKQLYTMLDSIYPRYGSLELSDSFSIVT